MQIWVLSTLDLTVQETTQQLLDSRLVDETKSIVEEWMGWIKLCLFLVNVLYSLILIANFTCIHSLRASFRCFNCALMYSSLLYTIGLSDEAS